MKFTVKKPFILSWISQDNWESLSLKEKDFIIMLSDRKYTKRKIMRRLYITNASSYWRIQKRVQKTLASDIAKRNKIYKKALNKKNIQ